MTDRRLQVFYEVARSLSFTKAAELLEMTQPAVTFQIRQLEEQFKVRLFDRSHNRIDLTDAGRRAFQYAERIFEIYQEMENSLINVSGRMTGTLRIGAGAAAAQYVLMKLLPKYQQRFPQVQIQLSIRGAQRVVSMVENSDVDIGLVEDIAGSKFLKTERYANETWQLVASPRHPVLSSGAVTAETLKQQAWVLVEEGASSSDIVTDFLVHLGLVPHELNVIMQISSLEAVKAAVENCQALTVLPVTAVEKELRAGELVIVKGIAPYVRDIQFIYKEQKYPLLIVEELLNLARNTQAAATTTVG